MKRKKKRKAPKERVVLSDNMIYPSSVKTYDQLLSSDEQFRQASTLYIYKQILGYRYNE